MAKATHSKPLPNPGSNSGPAAAGIREAAERSDAIDEFIRRRKKATINDVARLAQVSKKTVSRVINTSPSVREETRNQVSDIIARIGFRPDPQARGLAFRKSFLLGLVYDNPNAQYVVNMQMGILDGLRGTGMELVVHPCNRDSDTLLDDIRDFIERQRLAGVIILPPIAEDARLLALLDEQEVPYIRITARPGEDNDPPLVSREIVSRDRQGAMEAGGHIGLLGHRRVGYIGGTPSYPSAHERRAGFEAGLAEYGVTFAPELDMTGDYSFDSGYAAGLTLLDRADPPTAILCANDEMAAGVYKAAYQQGVRIPDDLSLVGFDDAPIATRMNPSLTTVRLPTRDMARTAAELLINPERDKITSAFVAATLMLRGSTGPV